MKNLKWLPASSADEENVFALMRAFYAEEHLVFRPEDSRGAIREILSDARFGCVFLLRESAAQEAIGYAAATWCYSLEFGGRYVLLDELWVAPDVRSRSWGRRAIETVRDWARAQGAGALRLEVNHHNARAMQIYLKAGFQDDKRDILTKRFTDE